MQAVFHLPPQCAADAEQFRRQIERYRSGAISAAELRAHRVPLGVYEQRENDTHMLRIRVPGGVLLTHQLRTLAEASRRFGTGVLHVTTRQDVQIHRVALDDVPEAFEVLREAGLSTRGGGGNTVRNITACAMAGVCPDEQFDVTGPAAALTEFLLPDPLSYQLPRKYKIAFSGCSKDCAAATVNDVGFIATRRNGTAGFAVYVAGGLGARSRVADLLEPFVPADEVHVVAETVKRVFDKHGNRKNRQQARLRFLAVKMGIDKLRELYRVEAAAVRASGVELPAVEPLLAPCGPLPASTAAPRPTFAAWRRRNVIAQKQPGFHQAFIPLWLGDITADRLEALAGVVERFGDGALRSTQAQNLVLRWIPDGLLPQLHAQLEDRGLAVAEPPILRNLIACAGASTCRLGICLSRGLARAMREALEQTGWDLDELGELRLHVSGCANSCGNHRIADVGLFGAARRVRGRLVPYYVVQLGGVVAEGSTTLAEGDRAVAARHVPRLVVALLDGYRQQHGTRPFARFARTHGHRLLERLTDQFKLAPEEEVAADFYSDWDAKEPFSLAGRGPGECGAGVFDLIAVDLASAEQAIVENRLLDAVVAASRALLVTQGQQADEAADALRLFVRFFLDEGLVDESLRPLAARAQQVLAAGEPAESFAPPIAEAAAYVEAVRDLHANMDPSLRFTPVAKPTATACAAAPAETAEAADRMPDKEVDYRGVVCPLNYVKTKMVLNRMQSGQVLAVLLDETGARNVPESVVKDGHRVLAVTREQDYWRVQICKSS